MFRSSRQALPTQRFQLARSGHFGRRRRRLRGQDVVPLEEPADALAVRPLRVDLDRTRWFLWVFRTQTRGLQRSRKEQKQRRKNTFFSTLSVGKNSCLPVATENWKGKMWEECVPLWGDHELVAGDRRRRLLRRAQRLFFRMRSQSGGVRITVKAVML